MKRGCDRRPDQTEEQAAGDEGTAMRLVAVGWTPKRLSNPQHVGANLSQNGYGCVYVTHIHIRM